MNTKFLCSLLLVAATLQSCIYTVDDDPPLEITTNYEPVYIDRPDFEASISVAEATTIDTAGKIYVFDNLLFINEKNKGFHVFSNTDPENPEPLHFIKAPGTTDVSIRNQVYYVNQAVDLVAFRYQTNGELTVLKRIPNVFPPLLSPDGFQDNTPENKVVIAWTPKID